MQRFHYDPQADAVYDIGSFTGVGVLTLENVSDELSPTEVDAAIDIMNARDEVLTFEQLYPLLQADEQSFREAEAAALIAAPTKYTEFRIIRDATDYTTLSVTRDAICEIRIIVGDKPIPENARVLVRWVFEGDTWVDYDE